MTYNVFGGTLNLAQSINSEKIVLQMRLPKAISNYFGLMVYTGTDFGSSG